MQDPITASHARRLRPGARCDFTTPQWEAMLAEHEHRCFYCGRTGVKLIVEHKMPLRRGGDHTAANVVPSCIGCNVKKGNQTAEEYAPYIDQERRAKNLAEAPRPNKKSLPTRPVVFERLANDSGFREAWDLSNPPLIPLLVFASRRISSDAKVLYALIAARRGLSTIAEDISCELFAGERRKRALRELIRVGLLCQDGGGYGPGDVRIFGAQELQLRGYAE